MGKCDDCAFRYYGTQCSIEGVIKQDDSCRNYENYEERKLKFEEKKRMEEEKKKKQMEAAKRAETKRRKEAKKREEEQRIEDEQMAEERKRLREENLQALNEEMEDAQFFSVDNNALRNRFESLGYQMFYVKKRILAILFKNLSKW